MYGFVREDQTNGIWWPMQFYRLPSVFNEWISLNKQQNIELHRWFLFFLLGVGLFLRFFFLFFFCLKVHSLFSVTRDLAEHSTFTRHTIECRCWEITDTLTISTFTENFSSFSGLSFYFFHGSVAKLHIENHFTVTFTRSIFESK